MFKDKNVNLNILNKNNKKQEKNEEKLKVHHLYCIIF